MRWQPELDDEEEEELRRGYISDNTAFARMQTELEQKEHLIDKAFLKRHQARIIQLNKFAPLSNLKNTHQLSLSRLRRVKIDMQIEADMLDDAEETALDDVADFQISRGMGGFYQKAMITQRQEIQEDKKEGRARRWGGFFKRKESEGEEGQG